MKLYFNIKIENGEKPKISFYDATYIGKKGFSELGQHVSTYYIETLMEHKVRLLQHGLNLYGGVPEWKLDPDEMKRVFDFIEYWQFTHK